MSRTIKSKAKLGLSIEHSDAGQYQLVVDGEITYTTKVLAAVELEYDELVHERTR